MIEELGQPVADTLLSGDPWDRHELAALVGCPEDHLDRRLPWPHTDPVERRQALLWAALGCPPGFIHNRVEPEADADAVLGSVTGLTLLHPASRHDALKQTVRRFRELVAADIAERQARADQARLDGRVGYALALQNHNRADERQVSLATIVEAVHDPDADREALPAALAAVVPAVDHDLILEVLGGGA